MKYIIELNEAESKALSHVTYDPQEWMQSIITERCRKAIDKIFKEEIERISSEGGTISGTKEDVVLNANIKTGKQINDEIIEKEQNLSES
jgi:hypothetical protein